MAQSDEKSTEGAPHPHKAGHYDSDCSAVKAGDYEQAELMDEVHQERMHAGCLRSVSPGPLAHAQFGVKSPEDLRGYFKEDDDHRHSPWSDNTSDKEYDSAYDEDDGYFSGYRTFKAFPMFLRNNDNDAELRAMSREEHQKKFTASTPENWGYNSSI